MGDPSRLLADDLTTLLSGADVVVVRILGGFRAWEDGIATVVASGILAVVESLLGRWPHLSRFANLDIWG